MVAAALFALVVLYIVAKRSAHFVPTGLLPGLPAFGQASNASSTTSMLPAVRGTAWNATIWAGGAAWHASVWTGSAAWNASVWTAAKLGSLSSKAAKSGGAQQQQQQVKLGGGRFGVVPSPPPPPPSQAPEAGYDRWADQASRAHWDAASRDADRDTPRADDGATAEEWPVPSDPAYEEPIMRYGATLLH